MLAGGHNHSCATPASMHLQVEKMNDEAVQLKLLQTALTLMQSSLLAQSEVCLV